MQFFFQLYIDIGNIIPHLQVNPYWLSVRAQTSNNNVNDLFCFLALRFLRKKRKELVVYWFSPPQIYCLKQTFNNTTWFWSKPNVFKMFWWYYNLHIFMSLNIVLILAPGYEFFAAKYDQFPLTFTEWN